MKTAMTGRPRTKPADIRRDELMDAAEVLFLKKGFAATSVSEIVEEADVAKGTFYLYFKTKDDVLAGLQTRFVETFCKAVDTAMAHEHADWSERIAAWVEACVHAYLDNVALHDLVFHQHTPANRAMKSDNAVVTRLAALLTRGAEAGAWNLPEPRLTAVMLFDALHGAVDDSLAFGKTDDREKLVAVVADFYRAALRLS
ncbi:transcriptional regulator [Xaviernesmea oryzae]|uniref:Transcriptional regulator n=1 Tax=Xaviernesmea oryzae TaxID=464029 RepID=A0A1Q9B203_9HYPH|nr:TetR/AcrR family transcriptional regulator [Xaviernesmea oryzae]OLP62028.1 transcriptional regulator [Xaviernesmea oryzae]SEK96418.1 transcriptional regulator, TetR family [Xaviernesmea oryzae]